MNANQENKTFDTEAVRSQIEREVMFKFLAERKEELFEVFAPP